jgi:hypothetical protein
MSFIETVQFNEANTAAGLPLFGGRFNHLSVPLGLVCVERQLYDKKRNIEISEVICDSEFNRLEEQVQHKNTTRSARTPVESKKTTKKKHIKLK